MIETLGEAIARDGAIIYGPTGPKAHPAIKDQIAARAFLVRTLERLGVTSENTKPGPGRPPTPFGWVPGGRIMSGTARRPLARSSAAMITPRALEAFRRLEALEAECVGPPECEPYKRCASLRAVVAGAMDDSSASLA